MEHGNTDRDSGIFDTSGEGRLADIREGMQVIDAAGEEIGKVEIVKMGDPSAATVGADADRDGGLIQDFAEAFGFEAEPELPAALRARLMRIGFVKVDAKGLFESSRYITPDKIAGVSADTVRLNVRKEQMAEEH